MGKYLGLGLLFAFVTLFRLSAGDAAVTPGPVDTTRAAEIALARAGGGEIVEVGIDFEDGERTVYEFTILDATDKYGIDVDAATGAVVKYEREARPAASPAAGAAPGLSPEQARKAALARTGGGRVTEFERDSRDDGRTVYEIEILDNGVEYELEIDAASGEILKYEEKLP